MKTSMKYGGNTYGNKANADSYLVKLSRTAARDSVSISFIFDLPAAGRGVGDAKGNVRNISVIIPRKAAQALSHALQLALSDTASSDTEFRIDETA
jgi:hypothetical protein